MNCEVFSPLFLYVLNFDILFYFNLFQWFNFFYTSSLTYFFLGVLFCLQIF